MRSTARARSAGVSSGRPRFERYARPRPAARRAPQVARPPPAVQLRLVRTPWVPGLLQTDAYARTTLAGEGLTPAEADDLVSARIARQSMSHRDRPPLLVVVIDELVLHRTAGHDRIMMREQCEHLARCAVLPSVQVYVVPAGTGIYAGHGGPFTSADLPDGKRVARVDGQVLSGESRCRRWWGRVTLRQPRGRGAHTRRALCSAPIHAPDTPGQQRLTTPTSVGIPQSLLLAGGADTGAEQSVHRDRSHRTAGHPP